MSRSRRQRPTNPQPQSMEARIKYFEDSSWLADYRENPENERRRQIQEGRARMKREARNG